MFNSSNNIQLSCQKATLNKSILRNRFIGGSKNYIKSQQVFVSLFILRASILRAQRITTLQQLFNKPNATSHRGLPRTLAHVINYTYLPARFLLNPRRRVGTRGNKAAFYPPAPGRNPAPRIIISPKIDEWPLTGPQKTIAHAHTRSASLKMSFSN